VASLMQGDCLRRMLTELKMDWQKWCKLTRAVTPFNSQLVDIVTAKYVIIAALLSAKLFIT